MKSQVLHTVWCYISGEAAGEIWHWSLLGVKGFVIISNAVAVIIVILYHINIATYAPVTLPDQEAI